MCRFVYYQGPPIYLSSLLTEPEHSLIHQSVHAHMREEPLNGDGFGVAWYASTAEPDSAGTAPPESTRSTDLPTRSTGRFRSISPAWSNQNLKDLAQVIHSSRILAHVRAASPGSIVSEMNSHPFRRRRMTFMHNGDIGGFGQLRRKLLERLTDEAFASIRGSTDSEHFFALLLDELDRTDRSDPTTERMKTAFRRALDTVLELHSRLAPDEPVNLNVVWSDGTAALVSRFTTEPPERSQTLFISRGERFTCEDGVCHMREGGDDALLVSSEPLGPDPTWESVPPGTLLLIDEAGTVSSEAL